MATLVTLALLIALGPADVSPRPNPALTRRDALLPATPRLRPQDSRAGALLLQGIERSSTMRAIVEEIETLDLIVYIEMHPGLKPRLAGRLTWMATSGTIRYVRITLNQALTNKMAVATLAHELQHALEVAHEPSIVDAASLARYYAKHGISMRSHHNGWDTEQARVVGGEVQREIAGQRGRLVPESIQAIDPETWSIVYRRARGMLPP